MKIYLGSKSQLKHQALGEALEFVKLQSIYNGEIEVVGVEIESGVPVTPNSSETYLGAKNRAMGMINGEADLYMGLESGLISREGKMFEESWCVIFDNKKEEWVGISSAIQLPKIITEEMSVGNSHVEIVNKIADKSGISQKDTWGVYSKNILSRSVSLYEASRNALVSYFVKHEE